jgi:hypothetical protein
MVATGRGGPGRDCQQRVAAAKGVPAATPQQGVWLGARSSERPHEPLPPGRRASLALTQPHIELRTPALKRP